VRPRLCTYPPIHVPTYVSTYLPTSIYLPACLPTVPSHPSTYLPTCVPTCLPTHPPTYLPACLHTRPTRPGGFTHEAEMLRDQILSLRRRPFARPGMTERDWLRGVAKVWEMIRQSANVEAYNQATHKLHMWT